MTTDPTGRQSLIAAIQRDDPSLGPEQLIAAYEAGPDLLRAAVAGMTRDQLLAASDRDLKGPGGCSRPASALLS
jgi:hypothetical protein